MDGETGKRDFQPIYFGHRSDLSFKEKLVRFSAFRLHRLHERSFDVKCRRNQMLQHVHVQWKGAYMWYIFRGSNRGFQVQHTGDSYLLTQMYKIFQIAFSTMKHSGISELQ